MTKSIS